jgi:hypothetical protein
MAGRPIHAPRAGWPILPEDVADFDNPPSPTAGQGAAHNDAATAAACRQSRVSRPAGVVCRGR